MKLPSHGPEPCASANSAISAYFLFSLDKLNYNIRICLIQYYHKGNLLNIKSCSLTQKGVIMIKTLQESVKMSKKDCK